jgi:hypothetical protein
MAWFFARNNKVLLTAPPGSLPTWFGELPGGTCLQVTAVYVFG